jgi:2-polyprenyl-3-methyl-5-hydroxy-6-metoxy-1,4-benzoquinol methylase
MSRPCEVCEGVRFREVGARDGHPIAQCKDCGLERLDPQPSDEELARVYGEQYYDAWGLKGQTETVSSLKQGTFRRVLRGAGSLPKGSKVLDCGAATGFLMEAARAEGYEPYGVELSSFGAGEIERKFGPGRAFCGHVEDARFEGVRDGDFHAVFMCDFLEHVRRPEQVLRRALALLAPRGVLAITTPKVGSLTHRVMGRGWTHYKVEHLFYFSPEVLERLLTKVGFERVRNAVAWKTMNLDYIAHQMEVYRHPVLSPLVKVGTRLVPTRFMATPFPIVMGELLAYAEKP